MYKYIWAHSLKQHVMTVRSLMEKQLEFFDLITHLVKNYIIAG